MVAYLEVRRQRSLLLREISKNNIKLPALFIGDSKYDYKAATDYDIDFLFMTCWTDLKNGKNLSMIIK